LRLNLLISVANFCRRFQSLFTGVDTVPNDGFGELQEADSVYPFDGESGRSGKCGKELRKASSRYEKPPSVFERFSSVPSVISLSEKIVRLTAAYRSGYYRRL